MLITVTATHLCIMVAKGESSLISFQTMNQTTQFACQPRPLCQIQVQTRYTTGTPIILEETPSHLVWEMDLIAAWDVICGPLQVSRCDNQTSNEQVSFKKRLLYVL